MTTPLLPGTPPRRGTATPCLEEGGGRRSREVMSWETQAAKQAALRRALGIQGGVYSLTLSYRPVHNFASDISVHSFARPGVELLAGVGRRG